MMTAASFEYHVTLFHSMFMFKVYRITYKNKKNASNNEASGWMPSLSHEILIKLFRPTKE